MKYPQYRVCQWLDASEEALDKPDWTIVYGIQRKAAAGSKWLHCARNGKPMYFESAAAASGEIDKLKEAT
jgi:hypothetical protein